jgi:hypothetical protein
MLSDHDPIRGNAGGTGMTPGYQQDDSEQTLTDEAW